MPTKRPKVRPEEAADPKETAENMADAVSYLCRVAVEEGFHGVLPDLFEAQQKLEKIASSQDRQRKRRS